MSKWRQEGADPVKWGRVRVLLELSTLLKPGMVVNTEDDQLWVDFKYDRLPHVCYSCERIRHYTTSCEIVLYKEPGPGEAKSSNLGYWLKAEARVAIPYWRVYHGNDFHVLEEEEIVPETLTQVSTREEVIETQQIPMEIQQQERGKRKEKEVMDV